MDPTFAQFQWFISNIMGVPTESMPSNDWLQFIYNWALNLTYWALQTIPCQTGGLFIAGPPGTPYNPSIYAVAVYNLGADTLVQWTQDVPPSTYWSDLRNKLGINSFQYGLIDSAHDQGTGESMTIPPQLQGMTLMDLQLSKTPWGRTYLAIAGQWGAIWGITI